MRVIEYDLKESPCCGARIDGSVADGVAVGWCSACDAAVVRTNPRTGEQELLEGASPWTQRDAS